MNQTVTDRIGESRAKKDVEFEYSDSLFYLPCFLLYFSLKC